MKQKAPSSRAKVNEICVEIILHPDSGEGRFTVA